MAVPFCVPKYSKVQQSNSNNNGNNNNNTNGSTNTSTTDAELAQLIQWKFIAQAMCQALREYYLQSLVTKDGFISGPVEILPNGKLKPVRK